MEQMNSQDASVTEPMLKVEGISKRFGGVQALQDVDLQVDTGEHVALVGDNGAGKSTLVKILTGAEHADDGSFWFAGEERHFRSPLEARRHGIETVYQTLALADHLDVVANLFLGRERYLLRLGPFSVLNRAAMKTEARALLERTGVQIPDLGAMIMGMSGGQRQGVAIARAAGWGSKMIVLDEPTAALGVQETAKVEEIIHTLKDQGVTAHGEPQPAPGLRPRGHHLGASTRKNGRRAEGRRGAPPGDRLDDHRSRRRLWTGVCVNHPTAQAHAGRARLERERLTGA